MSKSQLTNSLLDFCRGVGLTQPPTSPNQHLGAGWISCGHLFSPWNLIKLQIPWNPMENSWKSIGKNPIKILSDLYPQDWPTKTKVTTDCAQMIFLVRSERVATWRHAETTWWVGYFDVFWIWWVVWKSCNVAKTIRNNPSHHHKYIGGMFTIPKLDDLWWLTTTWSLNPMVNQISV
jgi:hypothetical protein